MKLKNFSLFSNSGIGEYGTNNINVQISNKTYEIKTVIANELLKERADVFKNNYPDTNMIIGSITEQKIQENIVQDFLKEKPDTGTFSPPCQGSSGLNAFKSSIFDFRNQLVKSIFKIFEQLQGNNTLKLGYLENVVIYYKEKIPGLILRHNTTEEVLLNDYIITKDEQYLNYQYFILSDNNYLIDKLKNIVNIDRYHILINNNFKNPYNKKYAYGFNENDIKKSLDSVKKVLSDEKYDLILPINTFDYIKKSFDKFGYNCELQTVRGEEYGGCQVRQRGFVIFFNKNLSIEFPAKLYKKSTNKEYNGKTIKDALEILDLIKIINLKDFNEEEYKNIPFVLKDDKVYIDTSITEEEALKELEKWNNNGCPNNSIPNLHFRNKLKERFDTWLEHTKEGTSAYKNKERHHRPYKLIEVIKKENKLIVKNNQKFTIKYDTKAYFKKNKIIDYIDFVTEDMKKREGNKEWCKNCRQWQIKNIKDRKEIENNAIKYAKKILKEEPNNSSYFIFMPIKGFEAATYKRASLNKVSSALTTKNGIGNSNTCHPIFNRTWTPKEYMVLFGIGYIYKNGEYIKSKEYIPPKGIKNIKRFANLLFEIHGEAIISTVAEQIMKELVKEIYSI